MRRRVPRVAIVLLFAMTASAAVASASRPPTAREFAGVQRAVKRAYDGFYCATRDATRVSTNRRWVVVAGYNNGNAGSSLQHIFLRRTTVGGTTFRIAERLSGGPGGIRPKCAGRSVPRDIGCGP